LVQGFCLTGAAAGRSCGVLASDSVTVSYQEGMAHGSRYHATLNHWHRLPACGTGWL